MSKVPIPILYLTLAVGVSGCAVVDVDEPQTVFSGEFALSDGTPEADGVLAFVNDSATTFEVLDVEVGLDSRAATNITEYRDGPDGITCTSDDNIIDSVIELDEIPWVGPSAINRVLDYAQRNGWIDETTTDSVVAYYEGVAFDAEEVELTLGLANEASEAELDDVVGLDRRAAANIVTSRPIESMEELAAVSYVGRVALELMRDYAAIELGSIPDLTAGFLADEAINVGDESEHFNRVVRVQRGIVTSRLRQTSNGGTLFHIADPTEGDVEQLAIYIAPGSGFDTRFLTIFDEVEIQATFTRYEDIWELVLDDVERHSISITGSGLAYDHYRAVQAAWHSTANNPEGVVRVVSDTSYAFMVPLPLFNDHPMWEGSPPGPPQDSGNEQDHGWNIDAHRALEAWLTTL